MISQGTETAEMRRSGNRAVLGAAGVAVLTSVHHAYGAFLYNTPWRLHAAFVSGLATAFIAGSLILSRRERGARSAIGWWGFVAMTLAVPVLLFGAFEGAYNHVLKDALHFGGASMDLMHRLFPPPTYELPDDAFFEFTGVLQVVPAAVTAYFLSRFVRESARRPQRLEESGAKAA